MKDVEYEPTEDQPNGYSQEEWVCELPRDQSSSLGVKFIDIVDSGTIFANFTSGVSVLNVDRAIVDVEDPKMYIPRDARIEVDDERAFNALDNRELAAKKGTLNTLVIRVVDSNGIGADASISQLRDDIFEDEVCLKSQYERCSYGNLKIEAFNGRTSTNKQINGGVVDLNVNFDVTSGQNRGVLQQAAFDAAFQQLGDLEDDRYDLVMFCMPPGTGNWLAYALINNKFSFYNNKWCSSVTAQLHEVGHNLNLGHSGQEGEGKYSDQQGVMGFSYNKDDQSMCFNPAKNFQLGWYEDQSETINGLNKLNPVRLYTLNGVSDYKKNPEGIISLRLQQLNQNEDYYIGFNRKDGMNKDTVEDGNRVTIVKKLSGSVNEYAVSMKVGSLDLGDSFTIVNFNGKRNVEIKYVSENNDRDAIIEVIDVENAPKIVKEPCKTFKVQIKTDRYPTDTSWAISEVEGIQRAIASSPEYKEAETLTTTEICLPFNMKYKFSIVDTYKDGLCCNQGKGFYKVLDDQDNELFRGGEEFFVDENFIEVEENPNPVEVVLSPSVDEYSGQSDCKDRKRKKLRWKAGKRKRSCQWISDNDKCNSTDPKGRALWKKCRESCGRC